MRYLLNIVGMSTCLTIFVLSTVPASAAKRDIPTYERDQSDTVDFIVQRNKPGEKIDKDFKMGQLGILLPSYDRESLYLAYRALILDQKTLEKQEQNTALKADEMDQPTGGIRVWMDIRGSITDKLPPRPIDQDRSFGGRAFGKYLNCGNGAFNFAAETLQALKHNPRVGKTALNEWVAAQDIVFELCGDPETETAVRVMPQDLLGNAPLYSRQLRQYQIAAAYFYTEKYDEALRRFDAIANDKLHPMRAWASHASLRTLLRSGSMDTTFAMRVNEIRNSPEPEARRRENFALAVSENQNKMGQIYSQILQRAKVILTDKSRIKQHGPVNKLVKQAGLSLVPDQLYTELSGVLGRFDKDVQLNGDLTEWVAIGNRLFDYRGNAALVAKLRDKYEYFDWIRTIQSCTDNRLSPNYTEHCSQDSTHALDMYKKTKAKTWLLATLVTAPKLTSEVEATFASALQAKPDSKEYLTVRYYMAKLLRGVGRHDEAVTVIQAVFPGGSNSLNPSILHDAASANNLFRQEMLSMSKNEQQALPFLMRESSRRIGADGDEILNRRLSSEDLLRLAKMPSIDRLLPSQLLVAAWWRSDMVGKTATAEAAARQLIEVEPALRDAATAYLKLTDADERHYLLGKAAMVYRISPQIFAVSKDFSGKRKPGPADWWCSFNDEDFKAQALIQRITPTTLDMTQDVAGRDAEMVKLRQIGTAADWLSRVAQKRATANANDPVVRAMLETVVKSEKLDCISANSDILLSAAKKTLASLPLPKQGQIATGRAAPEEVVRAKYEQYKKGLIGKQEFKIFHILVKSEAEANTALAKIQSGISFEDVARQVSTDIGTVKSGGDLGWALPDFFTKPFADVVRSMPSPGRYPKPVQTQFGWHLIEIRGIRPAQILTFEQAKPYIEQEWRKQFAK